MRLQSTKIALFFLPPLFIVYAWLVQYHVDIAGPVVTLVFLGFSTIWIYSYVLHSKKLRFFTNFNPSSTLTFVVDSNPGNAGSAVACNSLLRGVLAAISSQVSGPLIHLIGVGWFYTGFAVIILVGEMLLLATSKYGKGWREAQVADKKAKAIERPEEEEEEEELPDVEDEPIYAGARRGSHIDV